MIAEITNCCICGKETERVYELPFLDVYGMDHEYVQKINICPSCGFIFTANPFSDEQLSNRYKNMSKYDFDKKTLITKEKADYLKRSKRQHDFINNTIEQYTSVFEVGAASGYSLSLYQKDGIDVYGVEPSGINVKSCKHNYGIDLFQGMFQDYMKMNDNRKYDLIFLSHVLEHIVNPYQFISELSDINSCYMFIEVPTLDYKFIDEPFGMFTDEHVNYFTFESLNNLMHALHYKNIDANIVFNLNDDVPSGCPCVSTLWQKQSTPPRI
ncbi:hypothetical protein FACS189444_6690 [Spirochaetia bacterium]|nr:hypothetical protein FACS189444_6690 [Spirochaetia bacterium]